MKNYIVYGTDGSILRTGQCVDSDLFLQGDNVIEGVCNDDENHKVVDGQVVYSPKVATPQEVLARVREQRNARLSQSDWTQMPDSPLTAEQKSAWATYRQSLRDLPSQYQNETDYANVVFPNPPE